MFDQIDSAFQKGIAEHTNAAQQRFDSGHSQLAHTLKVRWKIILLTALLWLQNPIISFFSLKLLARFTGINYFCVVSCSSLKS